MTRHLSVTLEKRGAGSTFASSTEHTPVFNTVHIIAAVIGIIGALAGIITVIYLVRRKRSKKDSSIHKIKVDIEANMIQQQQERRRSSSNNHSSINNSDRFGQFASDFDNTVAPPKPVTVHVEDVSPMMQQYQLQLKLLQQQQQERNTLHVPQHTRANSASSSTSHPTTTTLLPPPPYHP